MDDAVGTESNRTAAVEVETDDATPISCGPYQLLPPLPPEVLAQLEASIRARGVEDPVAVDEAGRTLDGHHRRTIAERLGIPYETRLVAGLTEDEKRLYAIRRNTERRQLSKAQRTLVGMRAEPSFRGEAKARQGARTDLSPDLAKSRRIWVAEEAARLVGLPLTTFKTYKALITTARRERGAATVDALIELGTWDIAEVRASAEAYRQRAMEAQQQAQAEERARQAQAALEEEARRRWATHGLLGRAADAPTTSGEWWQCPSCEAFWPPTFAACERCGPPPDAAGDEEPPVAVDAPHRSGCIATWEACRDDLTGRPPVVAPRFSAIEAQPQPQELDDHYLTHLKTEDHNRLWHLQQSQL